MQALVIDDTSGYRALLSDVLSGITGVEVQGVAASGKTGLSRATAQTPDLVLVDVGLADIGLPELLNDLRALDESIGVILIDVDDLKPATVTLALKLSALGAVGRPSLQDERGRGDLAAELRRMIDGFQTRRLLRGTRTGSTSPSRPVSTSDALPDNTTSKPASPAIPKVTETLIPDLPLEVIGIGISTGGPNALAELLPALPGDLPVPILIVQHITDTFTASLVKSLDGKSRLAIFEGQEGVVPVAGAVYVAPGGRQMKVELKDAQARLRITDDPPVNHCKPAVDYLFDSISTVYGARALGVIMTGMGADGAAGLVAMRRAGARVLAQDEATSMIYGMPGAAVRAGVVDCILPLDQLAPVITRLAMAVPDPEVSSADLHRIALFVRERCGINLDETKGYLVQSRWRRLCQDYGGLTPTQLVERAHRGDEGLASLLIDTISTKETSFFRDTTPFDLLGRQLLKSLLVHATNAGRPLEIWSAACSTGQEVYSLGMIAAETLTPSQCQQVRITGSDLSTSALDIARAAEYGEFELGRGVSATRRQQHFTEVDGRWRLREQVRAMAHFEAANLVDLPPMTKMFDLILCRNIATYFDVSHRRQLFAGLAKRLRPHGILILGSTESLIGVTDEFVREREAQTTYYLHR